MNWIIENALTVYAAIVGTIALFLNFARFYLMWEKSRRRLKVNATIDKTAQTSIDDFVMKQDNQGLVGPIYSVTIINVSHIHMHLDDAGIIIREGKEKQKIKALQRKKTSHISFLEEVGGHDLAPGAKKTFSVWLDNNLKIPNIIGCYVVNQMGKEYRGKFNSNGQVLSIPDKPLEDLF